MNSRARECLDRALYLAALIGYVQASDAEQVVREATGSAT